MSDNENQILASVAAGLIGGFVFAFLIMAFLVKKVKPVRFQHGAASYVVENSFNLTLRKDIYLYRNVTKTRISKPNK